MVGGDYHKGPENGNIPVVHYAPTERPIVALDNDDGNHLEFKGPEAKIGKFCVLLVEELPG